MVGARRTWGPLTHCCSLGATPGHECPERTGDASSQELHPSGTQFEEAKAANGDPANGVPTTGSQPDRACSISATGTQAAKPKAFWVNMTVSSPPPMHRVENNGLEAGTRRSHSAHSLCFPRFGLMHPNMMAELQMRLRRPQ